MFVTRVHHGKLSSLKFESTNLANVTIEFDLQRDAIRFPSLPRVPINKLCAPWDDRKEQINQNAEREREK